MRFNSKAKFIKTKHLFSDFYHMYYVMNKSWYDDLKHVRFHRVTRYVTALLAGLLKQKETETIIIFYRRISFNFIYYYHMLGTKYNTSKMLPINIAIVSRSDNNFEGK